MLKIEQYEDDLFVITFDTETVSFSGLFQCVNVDVDNLVPLENGIKIEVKL